MQKRANAQTHYCILVTAKQIKTALTTFRRDSKNYSIQQDEYTKNAQALRKLYKGFFHTRDSCGWSQNKLSETSVWYYELNCANAFEPRCVFTDTVEVWYKIEEIEFVLPNDKECLTIDDLVMRKEFREFDGSCKVSKVKTCFLKLNLDRNRISYEQAIAKRKKDFFNKNKPTRARSRRVRKPKQETSTTLLKPKLEPSGKKKRKATGNRTKGDKKRQKAPSLDDMVCRIVCLLVRSCPRTHWVFWSLYAGKKCSGGAGILW
mgnify:CR=1 FL=1